MPRPNNGSWPTRRKLEAVPGVPPPGVPPVGSAVTAAPLPTTGNASTTIEARSTVSEWRFIAALPCTVAISAAPYHTRLFRYEPDQAGPPDRPRDRRRRRREPLATWESATRWGSSSEAAQAQRVGDHADAGEGHRGAGDHRAEQAGGGQRD